MVTPTARFRWGRIACVLGTGLLAWSVAVAQPASPPSVGLGDSFEGTFSATGRRDTVPTGDGPDAASIHVAGTLVITRGDGLARTFRVEAIGFEDTGGTGTGRALWVDERGDRIYSRMVGIPVQDGRRSAATITGGTGSYQGITGRYTFTWQHQSNGQPNVMQARSLKLTGRYRRAPATPAPR